MSNRAFPWSSQTTKHFVVIRKNKELNLDRIKAWLNDNFNYWALIVHKNDLDPKTLAVIPIHYHFLGIANKGRTPLSTWCNQLSKWLHTDTNGIEYDGYLHFEKSFQYLLHLNNKEKTPHKIDELIYSGWTQEEVINFLSCEDVSINFDKVYFLCRNEKCMLNVIKELGLSNFHRYRSTIWDIWQLAKRELAQERLGVIPEICEENNWGKPS